MKTLISIFTALLIFFTGAIPLSFAGSAEDKGLDIATQRKLHDQGWADSQAEMLMTLRNKSGHESIRYIRNKTLEINNDGDKSLTIFDRPRDVKGTVFLSFSHPLGNDEQWLYLPALKRVKRISSRNKSGPFMGSEFSFEDLSSFEIEKYSYKYLGDDACGTLTCYQVEHIPLYKHSGYTKMIVWIDDKEYRVHKAEYYDRKKSVLKTLTFSDYKQYNGKYWRADHYLMVNHQTGKSTQLDWKNYVLSSGLSEKDFNKNAMKRIR
ncbi:MAG: outer membrane lipoprotein-sorting protein [Gammaproteobacteria bacterium]|nr:outer membrane lipoprotein-sorting protein [Gammaproteobacteria bacterium]